MRSAGFTSTNRRGVFGHSGAVHGVQVGFATHHLDSIVLSLAGVIHHFLNAVMASIILATDVTVCVKFDGMNDQASSIPSSAGRLAIEDAHHWFASSMPRSSASR